ncbi:MAG TPA: hypothetical protein VF255_05700 [Solirubrobacterales bacterium]
MRILRASRRHPMRVLAGLCVPVLASLLLACGADSDPAPSSDRVASQEPFPSFEPDRKPPPSEYDGPLFELRQDYPAQMPPAGEMPGFFGTDFREDWRKYMMEAREYCLEGNTEVEWRVQENKVRDWYHMPWQHPGRFGREGIHGLTKEAPVQPFQLAIRQSSSEGVAYAVGIYNDFGGYAIGQVWKDPEKPDPGYASTEGFPVGTVVCKPLFLNMKPEIVAEQIHFLENPVQWQAYTTSTFGSEERAVRKVTLIQLDFMVRDERSPTGWIFGTFQYNGAHGSEDLWKNLVPVGMMWGNDPDYARGHQEDIAVTNSNGQFPRIGPLTSTPLNPELEETVVNPNSSELPATHLGWQGRLNGPVDNFLSSCMSCHMTASSPPEPLAPVLTEEQERPQSGTPEWDEWWLEWFENVGWRNGALEKFRKAQYALDYSLQLSVGLRNFYEEEKNKESDTLLRR